MKGDLGKRTDSTLGTFAKESCLPATIASKVSSMRLFVWHALRNGQGHAMPARFSRGKSAMEKNKLRLKEQASGSSDSRAWLHTRFAQPKLPSVPERLLSAMKRLARMLIIALAIVSAFLAIPFHRLDNYVAWQQVQDALIQLETQPDSLPLYQRLWATAEAANMLWDEPNGARPEQWHQSVQRNRYDACYGVIQILALGMIKKGDTPRGVKALDQLQQRTGLHSLPNLPCKDQVITVCKKCMKGKIETKCPACDGRGACKRCDGQGSLLVPSHKSSFSLNASLEGTQRSVKRLGADTPIRQNCPNCRATGKCTTCAGAGKRVIGCPACGGHLTVIDFAAYPDAFHSTVRCTITTIGKAVKISRIAHSLANTQHLFLQRSREAGNTMLSAAHGNKVFTGINPDTSSPDRSQTDSRLLRESTLARQTGKHPIWKVLPAAFLLFVGLLFVKTRWRKRKAHGLNALPGMEHFDSRELTDPLSLTAQESRNRDKKQDCTDSPR